MLSQPTHPVGIRTTRARASRAARGVSIALAGLALIVLAALFAGSASAHQNPASCTSTGVSISLAAYRADGTTSIGGGDVVEPGEVVRFRTTMGLPSGNVCNFEGGTVTITTPNGATSAPMGPVGLVTATSSWSSPLVAYTVDAAHAVGGQLSASTSYGCGIPVNLAKCTGGQSYGVAHTSATDPHTNRVAAAGGVSLSFQPVTLEVSKTATPAYDRLHLWNITKTVDVAFHELDPGVIGTSVYTVTLTHVGVVDSAHRVTGTITIHNPAARVAAQITGVSDSMTGGIGGIVTCPGGTTQSLAPGATLVCTYTAALPDAATRTNTATVTTSTGPSGASATAPVDFTGLAPASVLHEHVDVTDTYEGLLFGLGPWTYSRTFACGGEGGEERGEGEHVNVATIIQTGQNATATVVVECPAQFPASCVGHAVRVDVADAHGLPGEATADNTYSLTSAFGAPGTGAGHGDAQQGGIQHAFPTIEAAGITFSGGLSTGAVHSACDAVVWAGVGEAVGVAETHGFRLDTLLEGLPVTPADPITFSLASTTLREDGAGTGGAGSVAANVYDLSYGGFIGTVPYGGTLFAGPAPANTLVPLTVPLSQASPLLTDLTIGYVVLNAQEANVDGETGCRTDDGAALIVVLYDLSDTTVTALPLPVVVDVPARALVTTSVSRVAVSTCPDTGPGGAPETPAIGTCNAAAVLVDLTTEHLSTEEWGASSGFSRSAAARHVAGGGATAEARQFDLNALIGPSPPGVWMGSLHADAAVSACEVAEGSNAAHGEATINDLALDLAIPVGSDEVLVHLGGQALHSSVSVVDGADSIAQNFVDYVLDIDGTTIPIEHQPMANTRHTVAVGSELIVEVILNHQADLGGCAFEANAIRLRVFDPLAGGAMLLEVKIGHATAMAC